MSNEHLTTEDLLLSAIISKELAAQYRRSNTAEHRIKVHVHWPTGEKWFTISKENYAHNTEEICRKDTLQEIRKAWNDLIEEDS